MNDLRTCLVFTSHNLLGTLCFHLLDIKMYSKTCKAIYYQDINVRALNSKNRVNRKPWNNQLQCASQATLTFKNPSLVTYKSKKLSRN